MGQGHGCFTGGRDDGGAGLIDEGERFWMFLCEGVRVFRFGFLSEDRLRERFD